MGKYNDYSSELVSLYNKRNIIQSLEIREKGTYEKYSDCQQIIKKKH